MSRVSKNPFQHYISKCFLIFIHLFCMFWAPAEGFLSAQLQKSKIVLAKTSSSCLEASVSYHPVLQRCSWEAPDKNVTECIRQTWVTKHR